MSLIQTIKKLYINDVITNSEYLTKITSCELTTIYILDKLKNLKIVHFDRSYFFNIENISCFEKCLLQKEDTFIFEIILYRRSHTFLLVKEKDDLYLVSSYLDLYISHVIKLNEGIYSILHKILNIEFKDDIKLHNELFKTIKVPCLSLSNKYSGIKINKFDLYFTNITDYFGFTFV